MNRLSKNDPEISTLTTKFFSDMVSFDGILYKYFPNSEKWFSGNSLLTAEVRELIILSLIYSNLEEINVEEYQTHNIYLGKLCSELEVPQNTKILKAFSLTRTSQIRKQN